MLQAGAWPAQAWAKETCGDYFEVIDTRRAQGRAGESFSDHTARPFRVVLKRREPGAKTPRRQTEEAGGGVWSGKHNRLRWGGGPNLETHRGAIRWRCPRQDSELQAKSRHVKEMLGNESSKDQRSGVGEERKMMGFVGGRSQVKKHTWMPYYGDARNNIRHCRQKVGSETLHLEMGGLKIRTALLGLPLPHSCHCGSAALIKTVRHHLRG